MSTELVLTGLLPSTLHASVISTLSQFCEKGEAFSLLEKVYKRTGAAAGDVRVRVRALKLRSQAGLTPAEQDTRWSLTVLHKPEPARISPNALQYSVSEITVEEGVPPDETVSAFGFEELDFELRKRGTRWQRSGVLIEVYQMYSDDASSTPLDSKSHVVQASVRFSQPASQTSSASNSNNLGANRSSTPNPGPQNQGNGGGGNSGQEEREKALNALEGVKRALKGLVDLKRLE